MIYLEKFLLPIQEEEALIERRVKQNGQYIDNVYPCRLFFQKNFSCVDFEPLTILYGGNGSGKSTLLNLIAQKLELKRIAPYNSSEMFDMYSDACKFKLGYDDEGDQFRYLPIYSRIITSDDIFDYMLTVRTNNREIYETIERDKAEGYYKIRNGETVKLHGIEDYEELRTQVLSRQKSITRRKFIQMTVGQEAKLISNGETALQYFEEKLIDNTLYCLDEPENSLSPKMQLELVDKIYHMTRYCGCQMIIATHSPFILSINGAKIYDLDATPVTLKKWWELENVRIYYNFFKQHEDILEKYPK